MEIKVRYFSKSGNTRKLAEAIAEEVCCTAQDISVPLEGYTDLLFLGAAVYWGGISSEMKAFIRALDKDRIGKVAVFSTSSLAQRAFPQIQKELEKRGIAVFTENFYCRGQFQALYRGRPNEDDKRAARKFAVRRIKSADIDAKKKEDINDDRQK